MIDITSRTHYRFSVSRTLRGKSIIQFDLYSSNSLDPLISFIARYNIHTGGVIHLASESSCDFWSVKFYFSEIFYSLRYVNRITSSTEIRVRVFTYLRLSSSFDDSYGDRGKKLQVEEIGIFIRIRIFFKEILL